ncbi:hypothetical protein MASR1M65_03990 [Saprospiraceae bacterium]
MKALSLAPAFTVAIPARARVEAQEAGLITPDVCLLQPEVTEGPYYLDQSLIRQDITEGGPACRCCCACRW